MLKKYGKDGLVVLGVTLDDSKDEKVRKSVTAWLQGKKLPFATVNLEGDADNRPKTLIFDIGVPWVFVFDRDNRIAEKLPKKDAKDEWVEVDYDAIEKRVAELVKKRAR